MKHQITFRQYRAMDLFMFTALLCVGEMLITLSAGRWFSDEPWTLSLTPAVTAIVMVRWGVFAAIPAFSGAFVFCLVSGATLSQYVCYCVGNLAALALTQFLYRQGWKRLHEQVLLALLYGLMTALLMQGGRALLALVQGANPAECLKFFTMDSLSTLFSALLVWIMRRQDGMLEEQKHYLRRVAEEMEAAKKAAEAGQSLS